jgi:UTP--glucose-1-phosphate uridylyltransferase
VIPELEGATQILLRRYGFDRDLFERLRRDVAQRRLSPQSNFLPGPVEPLKETDVERLPRAGSRRERELRAIGREELRNGGVAVVILNGGMATRFGGSLKCTLAAVGTRSLLECKLFDVQRAAHLVGAEIATVLMNSFYSDAPVGAFLARRGLRRPLSFVQSISLRLNEDGSVFRDAVGNASLYTPGHGDFFDSFRSSGTLERLRQRGVAHVIVSSVDNVGARVDPRIIGAHVASGRPVTTEIVRRRLNDRGGAPARVQGRPQLVEGFRFPHRFEETLTAFATNTFVFDLDSIDRSYPLKWFYVEKDVVGRRVVQLERLLNEITAFQPTTFLEVPRTRFLPVKTPADLASLRVSLSSRGMSLSSAERSRLARRSRGRRYQALDAQTGKS